MMQARFSCFPRPVVCSICSEQYKDVHEHIQHMTTVHQMKASFRCSTCGEIFPSKVAVEAHLKTHVTDNGSTVPSDTVMAINLSSNNGNDTANEQSSSTSSKERDKPSSSGSSILSNIQVTRSACDAENVLALDIEEDEEEDGDDDLLKEVFSCSCGKAYFLRMSFDAHQKVCPVKMQQYSTTPTSTVTGNLESSYRNQSRPGESNNNARRSQGRGRSLGSLETLGTDLIGSESSNYRKMVESIHSDGDTNCKACQKPMKGFISLCNHLSRRTECREFYNDNFVPGHGLTEESSSTPSVQQEKTRITMGMADKSNNSSGKSIDSLLNTKRALTIASSPGTSSTSSPATVGGGGANSSSGCNSDSKTGQAPFTDLGPDDIIIAPADELIRRAYLVRNRVQCPRCTKIFGGKTPAVAYNNHRRNKHCPATQATVPYLKAKSNKNKDQQSSPQSVDILPSNAAGNLVNPQESDFKLPDQSQVRYYCKLCPTRDTKNRVSLGVHLTTYHGLPPVNISSKDGVALRCQTCYQTFNSKYFYNMHRYECDLTSPYIGILDADKMNESEDLNTPNTSTSESKQGGSEEDAHLPAPPPSIMPPPIQSISPTPNSSSQSHSSHRHRQQLSPTLTQKMISIRSSIDSKTPPQSITKVQPTFSGPPRGSAASNAYFTNNYTCTLCHKKGFPGPNAVRIHQKYQCVKRPLVPSPKSPYPSPLAKPRTKSYSRPLSRDESQSESSESRLALLLGNSTGHHNGKQLQNTSRYGLSMCDDCGRGPYNSEYYLLEHKRLYCRGGASKSNNSSQLDSSKFIDIEHNIESIPEPFSSKSKDPSQIVPSSSSSNSNNLIRPVPKKAKHSNDICLIIDNNMVTNGSYGKDKNGTNNNGTRSLLKNINNKHVSGHKPEPQDYGIDMNPENVPPGESNNIIECTACGFRESDVFKFIRHRLAHFSDKPEDATNYACYSCEICKGKIVISQLSRIRQHFYHHVKIYNTLYKKDQKERSNKKRPYPIESAESDADDPMITCPYCRACQFEDASGLSHHIKTSCPFRFRCIKCDRTFLSKNLLEDHKETCLDDVGIRSNNSKSLISCHHCGLKFTSKQRLFYHEQACHKVYNADVSQRVEELIERASTCAICGLRAKNYIVKAKHEVKCLEMALDSLGVKFLRFENIEDIDSDSSIVNGDSIDQSSLISVNGDAAVEEMEVEDAETEEIEDNICELMLKLSEEELEESLRRRFGIDRDCVVVLERLADDVYDSSSQSEEDVDDEEENVSRKETEEEEGEYDDYDEDCDSNDHVHKLESLKQIFDKLLHHLIPNDEVYKEIINGKPVDVALTSLLRTLGTDPLPETNHKFKYINNFRTNIQTFLQLSIEKETLEKASDSTRTVDEVLINLLNVAPVN